MGFPRLKKSNSHLYFLDIERKTITHQKTSIRKNKKNVYCKSHKRKSQNVKLYFLLSDSNTDVICCNWQNYTLWSRIQWGIAKLFYGIDKVILSHGIYKIWLIWWVYSNDYYFICELQRIIVQDSLLYWCF